MSADSRAVFPLNEVDAALLVVAAAGEGEGLFPAPDFGGAARSRCPGGR
ncbi:MAG: hypothetical protein LBG43_02755 [Treponema sp.]|nr:hypothetical protein [Treponema sp.]